MRKSIIILLALCFVVMAGVPAFAGGRRHHEQSVTVVEGDDGTSITGVKLDAPNLIKLDEEGQWTLGAEGGKAIMRGIFGDERDFVESDKGYFAFIKVTYSGQVGDLSKLFKKKATTEPTE